MLVCIAVCITLLAACGGTVEQRNNAGNSQFSRGNYEQALVDYQIAQVLAPDRPESYYNAASAYAGMNDLERASLALEQALKSAQSKNAVSAYYNLGNVYFRQSRYGEAVNAYQHALLIDPEADDARYNLEIALLRFVQPTPTAHEQQSEPQLGETDPETTPTDQPGGFDGPTPTPPPLELEPSATPVSGEGAGGDVDSSTPVPQQEGDMTIEQAERILDQVQQDQQSLTEFLEDIASEGDTTEADW